MFVDQLSNVKVKHAKLGEQAKRRCSEVDEQQYAGVPLANEKASHWNGDERRQQADRKKSKRCHSLRAHRRHTQRMRVSDGVGVCNRKTKTAYVRCDEFFFFKKNI